MQVASKRAEERRFIRKREIMLFPFITKVRETYDGFDASSGLSPRVERLTASVWNDGDSSQLDTIISEEDIGLYSKYNVLMYKHNASGTGTSQTMDIGKVFPSQKKLNKTIIVQHAPAQYHLIKNTLLKKLASLNRQGILHLKKQSAVVDYLMKLPTILARSCTWENVMHGFI